MIYNCEEKIVAIKQNKLKQSALAMKLNLYLRYEIGKTAIFITTRFYSWFYFLQKR